MLEFIVLYPRCGLGNRLRAMACAYALSTLENCPLYIHWRSEPDCIIEWNELFDASRFPMPGISMEELSHRYPNRTVFFNEQVHTDAFLLSNAKTSKYQGLIISGGHDFKHPEMSDHDLLHLKHRYYQNLLEYAHPDLQKEIANVSFHPSSMIGVHIRSFVPKFDTADQYDFESDTAFEVTTRFMNDVLLRDPMVTFFVACNNTSHVSMLEAMFGKEKIFVYQGIWSSYGSRETAEGIKNAFIELALLSKTKLILGTYRSSYSDEASIMGMVTKVCTSEKPHDQPYHCYGYTVKLDRSYVLYSQPLLCKLMSFH